MNSPSALFPVPVLAASRSPFAVRAAAMRRHERALAAARTSDLVKNELSFRASSLLPPQTMHALCAARARSRAHSRTYSRSLNACACVARTRTPSEQAAHTHAVCAFLIVIVIAFRLSVTPSRTSNRNAVTHASATNASRNRPSAYFAIRTMRVVESTN